MHAARIVFGFALFIIAAASSAGAAGFEPARPAGWQAFLEDNKPALSIAAELRACQLPELARQIRGRLAGLPYLELIAAWSDGAASVFALAPALAVGQTCEKAVTAADKLLRP